MWSFTKYAHGTPPDDLLKLRNKGKSRMKKPSADQYWRSKGQMPVFVRKEAHKKLKRLSKALGLSMTDIVSWVVMEKLK